MTDPGIRQTPLSFMRGGRLFQIAEGPYGFLGYSNGQVRVRAGSRAEVARALIQEFRQVEAIGGTVTSPDV